MAGDSTITLMPKVGMSGLFVAISPYDKLINPMVEYACVAVTSIEALVSEGQDPLTDIYLANEDTEDNYDADRQYKRHLVTLQAGSGELIVLPSRCLSGLPVTDGVRYVNTFLGISLSAIPENMDLTDLNLAMTDLVYEQLGVTSSVRANVIGAPVILSHEKHAQVMQARTITTKATLSLRAQRAVLEKENEALRTRLTMLEQFVVRNLDKLSA